MTSPLTPPTDTETALVLKAPDAPDIVVAEEAPGMVPVPAERQAEISRQARDFIAEIATFDARSPEFTTKVDGISNNVSDATANISALSSLVAATIGQPLIKVSAFSYGVRQAFAGRGKPGRSRHSR